MSVSEFRRRATLLLSNLEQGREVRTYLQQFSRSSGGCFAVIKVGGAIVAEQAEILGENLALLQALGLKPLVVFGAGPQLDARLSAAGIGTERVDDLRVTSAKAVSIVAEEVAATGLALIDAMASHGARGVLAPPALVQAEMLDGARYGRVGAAKTIYQPALKQLLHADAVPLVGCIAQDAEGRLLNVNADDIAREVARTVVPQKIVFLTRTGGLLDGDDQIIDSINLASDYNRLSQEDYIHSGMALKLQQIKRLLDELPSSSSVSITDARAMMRELFTHSGDGTLIRAGEAVNVGTDIDHDASRTLIEEAFGRQLRTDYFDSIVIEKAIYTERYRAAAIVTRLGDFACLDKFAVGRAARGEGLAKAVWAKLQETTPSLIWRSRQSNPFNGFYLEQADGFIRQGQWLVLWYGLSPDGTVMQAAKDLAARPEDFGLPLEEIGQ